MTLSRNLLAGLINSVWSAFIGLAVIPFYLKYLGVEAYGLIGFFVTTQAVLSLLDMGMAPTINREVARCSAYGSLKDAGKLLHTLAIVYWSMAVMIAVVILMLSPLISEYWLQSKQIPSQTISHALILMGLVVACRWPIGLYQGAVIGAQRLAVSSVINMIMVTISSLGAVIVLAFISPTIEAFFIWQACLGVIYTMVMRSAAWRIVGKDEQLFFDFEKILQFRSNIQNALFFSRKNMVRITEIFCLALRSFPDLCCFSVSCIGGTNYCSSFQYCNFYNLLNKVGYYVQFVFQAFKNIGTNSRHASSQFELN